MNAVVDPRLTIGANNPPLAERLAIEEAALLAAVQEIADRANQLPRQLVDETAEADIAIIGAVVRDANALAKRVEARRVEVKEPWLEGERTVDGFFKPLGARVARISAGFTGLVEGYRAEARRRAVEREAQLARERAAEEARRLAEAEEAERRGRERTAALAREQAQSAAREAEAARERADQAAAPVPVQQIKAQIGEDLTLKAKGEWTFEIVNVGALDLNALRPFIKLEHLEAAMRLAVRQGQREIAGARIYQVEKVRFA